MTREQRLQASAALCSIGIGLILALAAGEIYVRLASRDGYVTPDTLREQSLEYETSALVGKALLPDQTFGQYKSAGPGFINTLGYRGADFRIEKRPNTRRIIFLGGSSVFDELASPNRDWPHLVEKELHEQGYPDVQTINAGVPGYATWESLGRLYSEIWMLDPDYVVLYQCWNDIKYFNKIGPNKSLMRLYKPPRSMNHNGKDMVWNPFIYYNDALDRLFSGSQLYIRLRTRYWRWQFGEIALEGLVALNPTANRAHSKTAPVTRWGRQQYRINLAAIALVTRSIGARPVLMTQARLATEHSSYQDQKRIRYDLVGLSHHELVDAFAHCDKEILSVAEEEGLPVLDVSGHLSGRSEYFSDHIHTTPAGSEALAKAVATFLGTLLAQERRGGSSTRE